MGVGLLVERELPQVRVQPGLSSVDPPLSAMTRAHGTWKTPGGKRPGPGPRHDDHARRDHAAADDRFRAADIDDRRRSGEHDAGAEDRAAPHPNALDHDAARSEEDVVLDDDRIALRRLEHAADPDAARDVDVAPDLGAASDRRPGVDHRAGADAGADVHVAGHHDHAGFEERAVADRRRAGRGGSPAASRSRFEGILSRYSNGPHGIVRVGVLAEVEEDGHPDPSVDRPAGRRTARPRAVSPRSRASMAS